MWATRLIALAAVAALAGCAAPAERFDQRASALGFTSILLQGEGFDHRSYAAQAGSPNTALHVYIEHDGTPWASIDGVAEDPTPRTPYALELMAKDAGPRLLLGRPCYFQTQTKPPCSPLAWTHRRYSPEVVASMVAALRRYLFEHPFRHVVLIGYSGGGTLAWLMAARVPEAIGVVTIAANLDIDEWTRLHGYSPLAGSLNPATEPPLSAAITEQHYVGGRDLNVPPSVVRAFARRHPRANVIEIAGFDHICCWLVEKSYMDGFPR
jgi:hypothetical protein